MSSLASTRGAASKTLAVVLLAGILMLATDSSQAARQGDRGSSRGGRTFTGDSRAYRGGGRAYGSGSRDAGGRVRTYGRDEREYGGGGRAYARGGPAYIGGGRTYAGHGGRYYEGGAPCYGGARYLGSYGYPYVRPRRVMSFGIGLSAPYYRPPAYRYYVEPYPVESESGTLIVTPGQPPPVETEPGPSMNAPNQPPPAEREPGSSVITPHQPPPVETESGALKSTWRTSHPQAATTTIASAAGSSPPSTNTRSTSRVRSTRRRSRSFGRTRVADSDRSSSWADTGGCRSDAGGRDRGLAPGEGLIVHSRSSTG